MIAIFWRPPTVSAADKVITDADKGETEFSLEDRREL